MSFDTNAPNLNEQQILQQVFDKNNNGLKVMNLAGNLVPTIFDYISLSYTGSNLTGVTYKTGGSSGTTVATLSLGYDGSNNLTSVARS